MRRYYWVWLYAVTLTAFAAAAVQSMLEESRLIAEARVRASALATSIEDSVIRSYHAKRFDRIAKTVNRLRDQKRLIGMVLCPANQPAPLPNASDSRMQAFGFPRGSGWESVCRNAMITQARTAGTDLHWTATDLTSRFLYGAHPVFDDDDPKSTTNPILVIIQDLSEMRAHWLQSFLRTALITWVMAAAILALVASQTRILLNSNLGLLRRTVRALLSGNRPALSEDMKEVPADLQPLSRDIDRLAAKVLSLSEFQSNRNKEAAWLTSLRAQMQGKKLLVVANREPYIHQRNGNRIQVMRPASGLVTALEPILRQCGGLWVAHGSGTADRETANQNGEVAVPPQHPTYTLKRVWLTKEQEVGYYYGFSNEGLWPLCHLAHTRPTFRLNDWNHYRAANQKFCDAIPQSALNDDSIILVQDYHFALLPRMLKNRMSPPGSTPANTPEPPGKTRIGLFWHIPWPNPEAFGICPWSQELLKGMLGADVIGFHTQYHCNNFLETCNRLLEARVDLENFSVTMENHTTSIRAFPIGIDTTPVRQITDDEREELKAHYGIRAEIVAVGVDRLDYTKGLMERIDSIERFLEKNPEYIGRFTFVQMGSPSRTHIPTYRALVDQLSAAVHRVNARFTQSLHHFGRTRLSHRSHIPEGYRPIIFLARHHEWEEIQYFYQLGDLCLVTSLHDGMNLVAKEYVWCQRPDRGALILSKFAGASRELTEALVVNPYSIEEMADAIAAAIKMPVEERTRRMIAMKEKVQNHNAYHWASDLIGALVKKEEPAAAPAAQVATPGAEAPPGKAVVG